MAKDATVGVKSAYELALERLESQGIERPREDSLSEETRRRIAEARSKAEARLAEAEILFKDRLAQEGDPARRRDLEENYRVDRRRIEDDRDRALAALRAGG